MWAPRGDRTQLIVRHDMAQDRRASEETVFVLRGRVDERRRPENHSLTRRHGDTVDWVEGWYG